jgi:hypothetical protein
MRTWVCKQCDQKCTLTRVTVFPPEQCIYKVRGNGSRNAKWVQED